MLYFKVTGLLWGSETTNDKQQTVNFNLMRKIFLLIFLLPFAALAQSPEKLADSLRSGFRGLSVVNENVIWMSGRKGLVGVTTNSGSKWKWNQVKEFSTLDFRSLHAFDKSTAVMASAGTPAVILRTENGGKKWKTCFRSDDSAMFFDGMAFWDAQHGLIFGDPVKGRIFLMETFDGGKSWKEIPFEERPQTVDGEAAFAASGTTIRVLPDGHVWIATGGAKARLFHSRDYGHHWEAHDTPMLQGKSSQGIFSVCFRDTMNGIIVGGDYAADSVRRDNCFITEDGGKTWRAPCISPGGYRSCVTFSPSGFWMATGTSGTDISYDGGVHWDAFEPRPGFNTVVAYKMYGEVFLAGSRKNKFEKLAFK